RPPTWATLPPPRVGGRLRTTDQAREASTMMTSFAVLAAEEGGNGFWLPADFNEVIWNSTAFFVVVFLLWKFAGKTVAAAFAKRSSAVAEDLDAATETR